MPQARLPAGCSEQALTHHLDDGGNNRLEGEAYGVHDMILTKPCCQYNNAAVKSPDSDSPILTTA
jgi:hypothetical protein